MDQSRAVGKSTDAPTDQDGDAEREILPPKVAGAAVILQRNFAPFFLGSLVSYSGTWFHNIAQALLIYRLTGSTFLVGVVNFAQFAAILLLSPASGVAADRFDRRKLIVVTHIAASVLTAGLAILTWSGHASPAIVILAAFAIGSTTALSLPAMQAMVPSLVAAQDVPAAVALNTVTFNLSRALGPVLGVVVISQWDIGTAFLLNAVSYLVMIAGIAFLDPEPAAKPEHRRLRDSLSMVRRGPRLTAMIVLVALISLTVDPINTLTPGFATEIYGRPDTFTGFLIGSFGAGAVLGGFLLASSWRPSDIRMIVTLCLFGAMMIAFSLSASGAQGVVFLFVAGIAFLLSQSSATICLQTSVDPSHRGRVMALWTVSYLGIRPIGSLIDGTAATVFGLRAAGVLMTLPVIAGAFLMYRLRMRERRVDLE